MKSVAIKIVLGFFIFRYITRVIAGSYYSMPLTATFTYPYPYLAGLYAFLLTYLLLVNPLKKIENAMRLFKSGQFDARINIKSKDELGSIAGTFNELADRMEVMIHSERSMRANLGHEIRTPLARVMLHLNNVADHVDVENSLKLIEQEIQDLSDISSKLLKLAQIERGEFKPDFENVQVNALVCQAIKKMQVVASHQHRDITFEPPQPISIRTDFDLLNIALINLLDNSLRYSIENSTVQVIINLPESSENLEICVRDQGPGVAESDLDRIFLPFERTSQSRERNEGGTGLGLAICKTIIQNLDGTIKARNLKPGFEVCIGLPKASHG